MSLILKIDMNNICIYCKNEISEPSIEHVIPKAFATYGGDTWTLPESYVCRPCNGGVLGKLDTIFCRDSHDGIQRYHFGNLSKEERMTKNLQFMSDGSGIMDILIGRLNGATNLVSHPYQICIEPHNKSYDLNKWFRFFGDDPNWNISDLINKLNEYTGRLVIYGNTEFIDYHRPIIEKMGRSLEIITIEQLIDISNKGKHDFYIRGDVSFPIRREIVKIGFNFIAHEFGSDFVLKSKFDNARKFIIGENNEFGETNIYRSKRPFPHEDSVGIFCKKYHNNIVMEICFGIVGLSEINSYYIHIAENVAINIEDTFILRGFIFKRNEGVIRIL